MRARELAVSLVLAAVAALPAFPQADPTILPPQEIGTLRVGQAARGQLEAGDYTMSDGTWADIWYFQGAAGQRVVIDLQSRDFDAYLQLLDAAGSRLADDDDSGGGGNARIRYTLQATERYQIVVNNFGDQPRPGLYALQLQVLQAR